ncbi:ti plasmid DNA insertion sequence IS869 domain protein [Brucella grignonensis]|uniref:Ti plasmid DNA insertion sequence IS869 domain protein n=1 Tax=Brucella grignonensis TaxID=94627 RepID=A0A256FCH8_9HYPH|nr:ti plasmid DNA insertion sequence IS869 domain protein [Brucella grignonensis]
MLMNTDTGAVDHDDIAIESFGNLAQNMITDTRFAPSREPVVACGIRDHIDLERLPRGAVRNRHKMPLITRRSPTRGTPRCLFGNNG